jgi:hygromycin-B 7''-O-kinase
VYATGDHRVLKLYPTSSAPDSVTEARVLEYLAGLWVSRGDPRLLGRLLAAYGRSFDPRELLAYLLLHRHSNLPECLAQLPAPPQPTLDSLAQTWFGTT